VRVVSILAHLYTQSGRIDEGLKMDRKLVRLQPDDPTTHYNLACSLSLMSDLTSSFKALKRAIELGYDDLMFMNGDPDLSNLRGDNRFKALVKMIQKEIPAMPQLKPQAAPKARQARG